MLKKSRFPLGPAVPIWLGAVTYRWRWTIFAVLAVAFFITALSNDVYNLTSPTTWSWHVFVRKFYSVVAFTIIGAAYVWASGGSLLRSALVVAAYSGTIEIGQHFVNGHEPLYWNLIDILCGAFGGICGALIPWLREK